MRRSLVRGVEKLTKRYLIAVAAHNLGRILRKLFGIGKPKALQGHLGLAALMHLIIRALQRHLAPQNRLRAFLPEFLASINPTRRNRVTSTGC